MSLSEMHAWWDEQLRLSRRMPMFIDNGDGTVRLNLSPGEEMLEAARVQEIKGRIDDDSVGRVNRAACSSLTHPG